VRATDRDDAQTRLSTYGTLAPGRPNHHHLAGLPGRWLTGHVHGTLTEAGWGADLGYPGITLHPHGDPSCRSLRSVLAGDALAVISSERPGGAARRLSAGL
jgi:hypothetical protein